MFVRTQLWLLYGTIVSLYLCNEKYAESTSEFVDSVRNLSVTVFQNQKYTEQKDLYKLLKLNISWLPPDSSRLPSSYSIIITGISSNAECPEGSLFYMLKGGNEQLQALLPQYNNLIDLPDLYILPKCSYKVQVLANPRTKYRTNASEVLYKVPECIDSACSCMNVKSNLPTPKVDVTRKENLMVVNWSLNFNASNVQYYIISVGVPLLMSKKGLPVYNVTRVGQVSGHEATFLWNLKLDSAYTEVKDGYKVVVNAVSYHGCTGPEGSFIIHSVLSNANATNVDIWFILIGVVASCTSLAVLTWILCRNHNFLVISQNSNSVKIHKTSECTSQWMETILKKNNILYVKYESEKEYAQETDKLKVPFKSVKLMHELGTGQFGKVYLGCLNDTNNTLVAVKMSQQIDLSAGSETRQQFLKEIEMMRMAGDHPHLVRLIGYCVQSTTPICILLEYMQGGDLLTYLHRQRNHQSDRSNYLGQTLYTAICSRVLNKTNVYKSRQYTNMVDTRKEEPKDTKEILIGKTKAQQFLKFATEIVMGMEHLELKGIIHRDLAARNILLGMDLTVKISDFGLSRTGVYVIKNTEEKTRQLPIRWMSPEALRNGAFSSKGDVWSFGVVLWEISTLGGFPYSNVQDNHLLRYIIRENGRLEQPDDVPSNIYKLMYSCWATEPENRPNFTQLLSELQTLTAFFDDTF